jgi:hypothetical protein
MTTDLDLTGSQGAWLFAAYQATFASFLLVVSTNYTRFGHSLTLDSRAFCRAEESATYIVQVSQIQILRRFDYIHAKSSIEPIFIAGNIILGVMSLGAGFVHNKIGLLVLRGFSGIGELAPFARRCFPPSCNLKLS